MKVCGSACSCALLLLGAYLTAISSQCFCWDDNDCFASPSYAGFCITVWWGGRRGSITLPPPRPPTASPTTPAPTFSPSGPLIDAMDTSVRRTKINKDDQQMMGSLDLMFHAPEGDNPATPFLRISFRGANCYLIKGRNPETGELILMLFDAGLPWQSYRKIVKAIEEQVGFELADLRYIFISHAHADHYGSAKKLRAKTGAQIIVHEADVEFLSRGSSPLGSVALLGTSSQLLGDLFTPVASVLVPKTRPDIIVRDGDSLQDLGFHAEVVHFPGHTKGHTALVFNYEGESHALVADLMSHRNNELTVQKSYAMDWNEVYASARELQEIWNPDYSYPGHGDRFSSEVLQALNIEENRIQ